jgi:hypothetical protein
MLVVIRSIIFCINVILLFFFIIFDTKIKLKKLKYLVLYGEITC